MPRTGKKQKLFNLDEIEREHEEVQYRRSELVTATERFGDLSSSVFSNLSTDIVMAIATIKFGLSFVQYMRTWSDVIPVECGPWREDIGFRLFKLIRASQELSSEESVLRFSLNHSDKHLDCLQSKSYEHVFARMLQQNTTDLIDVFAGCLSPQTHSCLVCLQPLQKYNNSCCITYYLPSGPLPKWSVMQFELWNCQIWKYH